VSSQPKDRLPRPVLWLATVLTLGSGNLACAPARQTSSLHQAPSPVGSRETRTKSAQACDAAAVTTASATPATSPTSWEAAFEPEVPDSILLALPNPPGPGIQFAVRQATAGEAALLAAHVTKADVAVRGAKTRLDLDLAEGDSAQWFAQIAAAFGLDYVNRDHWNILAPTAIAEHWLASAPRPSNRGRDVALDLDSVETDTAVRFLLPLARIGRTGSASGMLTVRTLSRSAIDVLHTICGLDACRVSKMGNVLFTAPVIPESRERSTPRGARPAYDFSLVAVDRMQVRGVALVKQVPFAMVATEHSTRVVTLHELLGAPARPIVAISAKGVELGPIVVPTRTQARPE
jgi:hypothetical protein